MKEISPKEKKERGGIGGLFFSPRGAAVCFVLLFSCPFAVHSVD